MTSHSKSQWRLERAYAKLMWCLNDDTQTDCLYKSTLKARDEVNRAIKAQGKIAEAPKTGRIKYHLHFS